MSYKKKPGTIQKEREAQRRWHAENTEYLNIGLRKGQRARYKLLAQRLGVSLASIVKEHLDREFFKEVTEMEYLGIWNNDDRADLYELNDGRKIAVSGWNGETWAECWEVFADGSVGESFGAKPVYRFEEDGIDISSLVENSPEWCRAVEFVGIEKR